MPYPTENPHGAVGRMVAFQILGGILFLLLLVSLPGGTVQAETGKPPDRQAALRGAKLYQRNCQSCHGERGVGEVEL